MRTLILKKQRALKGGRGAFTIALGLGMAFQFLWVASSALAETGVTTRRSVSSSGTQGDDISYFADISGSGRYISFSSRASTLVSGDTNNAYDVFVHDRQLGQTRRVSVSSLGQQAATDSLFPAMSGDGRYVAFDSGAASLVPGTPSGVIYTFVHDTQTGQTTNVSVNSSGVPANSSSLLTALSFDGRFVAFSSFANNLVPNDNNASSFGGQDVFVHDRSTGETTRVSVRSDGGEQNGFATNPSISADGRFVAFECSATNLVAGDTSSDYDVFVHDRLTGETIRASVSSAGEGGNSFSVGAALSANGRFVGFWSDSDNLVPNDTNGVGHPALGADVFVRDLLTRETTRVSVNTAGEQGNFGSYEPDISADGRFVAFWSVANNLVFPDLNGPPPSIGGDIFIHDRRTGVTTIASVTTGGAQGEGLSSTDPAISDDGRFVAFDSEAVGLVPEDTNGTADLFLRERTIPLTATRAVSRKMHGPAGAFDIDLPSFGLRGVEGRSGGPSQDYQLVISFARPISVGTANIQSGTGSVSNFVVNDSAVLVNLTGVTSSQNLSLRLGAVNDGSNTNDIDVSMGVLTGDANGDGTVNSGDAQVTRNRSGQPADGRNFRSDVNTDGTVNSGDAFLVRARSGTGLDQPQ